jgi:hypothetical protein
MATLGRRLMQASTKARSSPARQTRWNRASPSGVWSPAMLESPAGSPRRPLSRDPLPGRVPVRTVPRQVARRRLEGPSVEPAVRRSPAAGGRCRSAGRGRRRAGPRRFVPGPNDVPPGKYRVRRDGYGGTPSAPVPVSRTHPPGAASPSGPTGVLRRKSGPRPGGRAGVLRHDGGSHERRSSIRPRSFGTPFVATIMQGPCDPLRVRPARVRRDGPA